MSILIRNMEMPEECRGCPFETYYFHTGETRCRAMNKTLAENFERIPFEGRSDWCPLVEVKPHGDLIDANRNLRVEVTFTAEGKCHAILTAPTVIPADEGK